MLIKRKKKGGEEQLSLLLLNFTTGYYRKKLKIPGEMVMESHDFLGVFAKSVSVGNDL